jgi:deoxyribodipyrimidine photo-lyase
MIEDVNIVWFRNDLRISDNPALFEAVKSGNILPIYILDNEEALESKIGGASRYWLHNSLESLNKSLDNKLNIYVGNPINILLDLIKSQKFNIKSLFYNKIYEPFHIQNDKEIENKLKGLGVEIKSFNCSLLWDPEDVKKSDGTIYKVFTPFYRNGCANAKKPREPLSIPLEMKIIYDVKNKTQISNLKLLPTIEWYKEIEEIWEIGEKAAQNKLYYFLDNYAGDYKEKRNYPSINGTSKLSPYLHFGEISPNQIYYAALSELEKYPAKYIGIDCFLSEIGWREFSYYLLYHFPDFPNKNFQKSFDNFPWEYDEKLFEAWSKGITGYPIVDAGMRELYRTGYMHNRVRMIVASFLVKNLMINWQYGASWFQEHLLDADLASNSASWQWVAGSGADAAPYFRIFNPVLQGEKFDLNGEYTKKYVPELNLLPNKYLFKPWEAPKEILEKARIILGTTYPKPIVDINISRKKALDAYKRVSSSQISKAKDVVET